MNTRGSGDHLTDEELISRHVSGDGDAFGILIRRHQKYLYAVARRTSPTPEDADDALQEALIKAFRTAGSFRADARVTSWLHRIVVNACLDRIRHGRVRATVPLPEFDCHAIADPRDEYERRDLAMAILAALDTLPVEQRAAVVAIDVEGLSMAEASALLGVPVGTIKSRCSRARTKLVAILEPIRIGQDRPEATL